jgi:transcription termination/antitermination protein NusG
MSDMENAVATEEVAPEVPPQHDKKWYVVKVQSGREDSIRAALERRARIEGVEEFFGQLVIPEERTTELVKGKKVTKKKKLYPGYLMVECAFNEKVLALLRDTPGVNDFLGGASLQKPPQPLPDHEVQRMLHQKEEAVEPKPVAKIDYSRGDRVKVKDGMFANMEGEVNEILEAKGLVRVMLKIFGRDVPVELESWQLEHI